MYVTADTPVDVVQQKEEEDDDNDHINNTNIVEKDGIDIDDSVSSVTTLNLWTVRLHFSSAMGTVRRMMNQNPISNL